VTELPLHPNAPDWFRRALAVPFEDGWVEVRGARVHYLAWGEPDRPGMVLVHGGGAHAHWWTHVAARFHRELRVVAIDLSGHGDSDRRDEYEPEVWAAEVMAVAGASGIAGKPVVVGHSMGGFITILTAALHADDLAGAIVIDSPVAEPDHEVRAGHLRQEFGHIKTYATVEEAVARFRTVPPQDHYLDYVMDHVARRSLRPVDGGYQWKFDRRIFEQFASGMRGIALPYLGQVRSRLALLRCQHGLITTDIKETMYEAMGRVTPVVELPDAGHHPMLDQPLVLLTAIRALLADWAHSEPLRR